jgi:hypothetical protein
MHQILFEILTNEKMRRSDIIETSLDKEFIVSAAPWFSKIFIEAFEKNLSAQ